MADIVRLNSVQSKIVNRFNVRTLLSTDSSVDCRLWPRTERRTWERFALMSSSWQLTNVFQMAYIHPEQLSSAVVSCDDAACRPVPCLSKMRTRNCPVIVRHSMTRAVLCSLLYTISSFKFQSFDRVDRRCPIGPLYTRSPFTVWHMPFDNVVQFTASTPGCTTLIACTRALIACTRASFTCTRAYLKKNTPNKIRLELTCQFTAYFSRPIFSS
jgi:hypothetical protein